MRYMRAVGDRAEPCTTAAEGGQVAQAAVLGAGDDVVGADRRLTCDASMFRDLVLAASSPANDSVPEERRVVVDRDAMRNMCDVVVKTSGIRASAGDTASALGATNDAKIPEYISPLSASAKQNGRRGTIDPESLMNMLKLTMLSPAMSLVAASTPSQAAAASSEKREPGDARRTTIDPAQFEDLLAQITSATKPGVGAEEDVAESALKVSSTPREVSTKARYHRWCRLCGFSAAHNRHTLFSGRASCSQNVVSEKVQERPRPGKQHGCFDFDICGGRKEIVHLLSGGRRRIS